MSGKIAALAAALMLAACAAPDNAPQAPQKPVVTDPVAGPKVDFKTVSIPVRGRASTAWWSADESGEALPAVILLPECGAADITASGIRGRLDAYARFLRASGWNVLVPDLKSARGATPDACMKPAATQRGRFAQRIRDLSDVLKFVRGGKLPVKAGRIAVVGWGEGGAVAVAASSHRSYRIDGAVAYYPTCRQIPQRRVKPLVPTLLMAGESDESLPSCNRKLGSDAHLRLEMYPAASRGFDAPGKAAELSEAYLDSARQLKDFLDHTIGH